MVEASRQVGTEVEVSRHPKEPKIPIQGLQFVGDRQLQSLAKSESQLLAHRLGYSSRSGLISRSTHWLPLLLSKRSPCAGHKIVLRCHP